MKSASSREAAIRQNQHKPLVKSKIAVTDRLRTWCLSCNVKAKSRSCWSYSATGLVPRFQMQSRAMNGLTKPAISAASRGLSRIHNSWLVSEDRYPNLEALSTLVDACSL